MQTVLFQGVQCNVVRLNYGNGRVALQLIVVDDGEQMATATTNLPEVPLAADEVIIKTYSENAGLLEALVAGGIVTPTGRTAQAGFHAVPICRLLP